MRLWNILGDRSDRRGTALLDTLVRDVRDAVRSVSRAPAVALTIVTTVGLGLGLVTVAFTVLNAFVFRADEVRNPEELFEVARRPSPDAEPVGFTRAQYDALVRDTAVFSEAFAARDIDAWIEGRRRAGRAVTENFFSLLGVGAARGRTLTSSDETAVGLPPIVLSHRAWSLHFAGDPGVLDRPILLNGAPSQVVGVMPEGFRGLQPLAAADFWAPLSRLGELRGTDAPPGDDAGLTIVGRLKPGVSRGEALARLLAWDSPLGAEPSERPTPSLVLEPRPGTVSLSTDVLVLFLPLFFAFGLILMIGCANVANLLLARGIARQREIGIRLAIGASRGRIIWQLLTESLLLALLSAAVAFGISRLALAAVVHALTTSFPPELGDIRVDVPPADWRVALFLMAGALASTLLFALMPALQATRLELVRAIRGEVIRDARPGRARDRLLAMQVTGSVLLLICAAVFVRSSWAAAAVDPGIRTADTLMVTVLNEQRRRALLDVVRSEPLVTSVAASWPGGVEGLSGRRAYAEGAGGRSAVTYHFASPEYFGVLGIELVRGRGFTPGELTADAAVVVVSEAVARELWPEVEAVGQVVRVEADPESGRREPDDPQLPSRSFTVVGVARDVPGFRLGGQRLAGAGVYVPISAEAARTALTICVRGDSEQARQALVDRLAAIDPNLGEVFTFRTIARAEAFLLAIPFWLTLVLGTLGLLLTLSGLFSVLSYLVAQRTREFGVRMALGASGARIGALVLSQSARPVGIGLLLGGSLTAGLGAALLATPAAEQIGTTVRLFDPVAYAVSLLCIVAACAGAALMPALRAGRTDPVSALRQD